MLNLLIAFDDALCPNFLKGPRTLIHGRDHAEGFLSTEIGTAGTGVGNLMYI